MFRWYAFGPLLIGSDEGDIDPEPLGQVLLGDSQGATLPPDAPAHMPVDRRHDAFSTMA
jgi:hypothetical protein